jgi:hypothetical protein
MKPSSTSNLIIGLAYLLLLGFLASCKKSTIGTTTPGLSQDIQNIVPTWLVDSLRNDGMAINEGQTPPVVDGIYLFSPNVCTYDNTGDFSVGRVIDDYKYKFYGQNNTNLTIMLDYKDVSNPGTDSSQGAGAFVSGKDSLFSLFIQTTGVTQGIDDTLLSVYSGKFTAAGIVNFQQALYIKGEGPGAAGILAPVGTTRIFEVGSTTGGLAPVQSSY